MTRLVSMVHAQQQAWSQRVAARPTLTEQPTTAPLQQFEQDAELSEKGVDACAEIPTVPGSESHSLTMSTMEQPPYFDRCNLSHWYIYACTIYMYMYNVHVSYHIMLHVPNTQTELVYCERGKI